jgi:hypothetical protein
MSIKIYLKFEEDGFPEKTSKLQIPAKWQTSKIVTDVIELFAKGHNTKNPDHELVSAECHLVDAEGNKIYSDVICGTVLGDHSDYHIKRGAHVQKKADTGPANPNMLRCKNYGCQKYYDPNNNPDDNCMHHTGPPVFHETAKYWSCCPQKKAYDFESFLEIVGCAKGPCSQVNTGAQISASPNAVSTDGAPAIPPAAPLKSISDYNTSNPEAVTSEMAAVKLVTTRKSTRNADGITAKCQRKGCQQTFTIADNHSDACTYHCGQPIFHDAAKYWSCCADKKKYDFDAFMAVPGCSVGFHDDGVIEL